MSQGKFVPYQTPLPPRWRLLFIINGSNQPSGPPDDGSWLYFPSAHSLCVFVTPQIINNLKHLPPQLIKKVPCLKEGWRDGQSFHGDENSNLDSQWTTVTTTTIIIFTASSTAAATVAEMYSYSIKLRESIAPSGALNRLRRHPNLPSSDGMSLENNCCTEDYTITILNMSE